MYAPFIYIKKNKKPRRPDYLVEFKKIRNKLGSEIKRARTTYYQNKFSDIFNDARKMWKTVNNLLSKNESSSILELTI